MDLEINVSELMTADPVYAEPDNSFSQARDLFMKFNLHHLPIVESGNLIGIISSNDITRAYISAGEAGKSSDDATMNAGFPLTSVMTKNPVHISPTTSLGQAVKIFKSNHFQALPVVELGKLKGIITLKDIVKHID